MRHTSKYIFFILSFLIKNTCFSQSIEQERIEVGKPCPAFTLMDVHHFSKKNATLNEFKGKWLILDFWNEYCATCVSTFPETNSLQKEFADKVQFLLVGYTGSQYSDHQNSPSNTRIKNLFERFRRAENLQLPIAYDSVLFHKFKIIGCPVIIVIDDHGIVRGITTTINSNNINEFLSNKSPLLNNWGMEQSKGNRLQIDKQLPFLTYGNGGEDTSFLFRSLLSSWNTKLPFSLKEKVYAMNGRFELFGITLKDLYKLAYTGTRFWGYSDSLYNKFYPNVKLEVKDSSTFVSDYNQGKNVFCYSVCVPKFKAETHYLMKVIQRDLQSYFGFVPKIERRKIPCWKLVATDEAKVKLRSKGIKGFSEMGGPNQGRIYSDFPLSEVLANLYHLYEFKQPPFVNSTGIDFNVDIKLNGLLGNFDDMKRALNENGLDLIKSETEMNVLIISDPKLE